MAPGDHREGAAALGGDPSDVGPNRDDSHWMRWHQAYENAESPLSLRLRLVQSMVRDVLDGVPADRSRPIRIVSICAGQGRDVIDVVADHPRRDEVSALLVELDPALAAFARARAAEFGVADRIEVAQGDASRCAWYEALLPADLVLVCGVFGNISRADISHTIRRLPRFCGAGSEVIWTRHRRPPDLTPSLRAEFAAAGFEEVAFEAPDGFILAVGRHRFAPGSGLEAGGTGPFDRDETLFDFVGDGGLPA